jgi:hypothetical protein
MPVGALEIRDNFTVDLEKHQLGTMRRCLNTCICKKKANRQEDEIRAQGIKKISSNSDVIFYTKNLQLLEILERIILDRAKFTICTWLSEEIINTSKYDT